MITPDAKYIPQAKGKKKLKKKRSATTASAFPIKEKKTELKSLKKSAPFGKNYVWSN